MALVYPVLVRNDLPDNLLQFVDVRPNTSQANVPFEGVGNTGYITHWVQNDLPAVTDIGAGVQRTNANYVGLAAYLLDNIENTTGNVNLTPVQAALLAGALLVRAGASLPLALANINTAINAVPGVTGDLDGTASNSTGSVRDILAILAGHVYMLPGTTVISGAAGAFLAPHTPAGHFLVNGETGYRDYRNYQWTGSMNLSCLSGQLSKLNDATYTFLNPSFVYGAGGTAVTIASGVIPVTGVARAVVVYLDNGTAL